MTARDSARTALRSATAGHHDRVDAVFSRADLTDRDAYGRFLTAQAAAHIVVEEALTRGGAGAVLDDWPARLRAPLLRADLAAIDLAAPDGEAMVAFDSPAAVLGGVYVLEGSRLGGTLLRRTVPAHFPSSFLGASDSAAWRRLLMILDEQLLDAMHRQIAIKAAIEVFVIFERSGQRFL